MKNLKWWLFGGCSIMSLVISIVTICSFENYDVDKTSMLMSGFSLFVSVLVGINALLIGWQIFNYLSWKDTIQEIVDKKLTDATRDYTKYTTSLNRIFSNYMLIDGTRSASMFNSGIEELSNISQLKDEDLKISGINHFYKYLYSLSALMRDTHFLALYQGKKEHYKYIIRNIPHEYQSPLLSFLEEVNYTAEHDNGVVDMASIDGGFHY